jgi:hypothetical protein
MPVDKSHLASILSRLSGSSYENCLSAVNKGSSLSSLAGQFKISDSVLAAELSSATGRLYEDSLRDVSLSSDMISRSTYRHGWGK